MHVHAPLSFLAAYAINTKIKIMKKLYKSNSSITNKSHFRISFQANSNACHI